MAKYKVGDKVRIRSDLKVNKVYYMEDTKHRDTFVSSMEKFKGKVVTIRSVSNTYSVEECGWNWSDEMFEGLAEEGLAEVEFHQFDTIKHSKYGIGTVIGKTDSGRINVDFDNWNEDFPFITKNIYFCNPWDLTLVEAYTPI